MSKNKNKNRKKKAKPWHWACKERNNGWQLTAEGINEWFRSYPTDLILYLDSHKLKTRKTAVIKKMIDKQHKIDGKEHILARERADLGEWPE